MELPLELAEANTCIPIRTAAGKTICSVKIGEHDLDYATRIRNCVNACVGISNTALEQGVIEEMRDTLKDAKRLLKDREGYDIVTVNNILSAVLAKLRS